MPRLLVLSMITALLFQFSCKPKSKVTKCETCGMSENFVTKSIKIINKDFIFKVYDDDTINSCFAYRNQPDKIAISNILRDLKIKYPLNFDSTKIVSLTVFVDKKVSADTLILINNIKGLLLYSKESNYYRTLVFKFLNNESVIQENLSLVSYIISSNDINLITRNIMDSTSISSISLIDFKTLVSNDNRSSIFQSTVRKYPGVGALDRPIGGGEPERLCNSPCIKGKQAMCTAQEGQTGGENWFCVPDCSSSRVDATLFTNDNIYSNYDFNTKNNKLHKFRDTYLKGKPKGEKIIELYYNISKNMSQDTLSLKFCLETMRIMITEVLPKIEGLSSFPTSSNILINSESRATILNYLLLFKKEIKTQTVKDSVDEIIKYLSLFEGKDNKFITMYLSTP